MIRCCFQSYTFYRVLKVWACADLHSRFQCLLGLQLRPVVILVRYIIMCSATCLQGLRSPVPARTLQFSQYLLGLPLILPHCRFISATCLVLWAGISV